MFFAVFVVVIGGCAVPPRPVGFDPSSDQPATTDGLYRMRSIRVAAIFAKPGTSLSGYDGVWLDPVTVSYKEDPRPATALDRTRGNFALDEVQMERLKRIFRETFERALFKGEVFAAATEAGPGVLRVAGHVVDLVVNVPPSVGRERHYVFDAGEMTLLLDVRDSQTAEPLLRIVDRRGLRPGVTSLAGAYESGPVTNAGALRDMFSEWALVVRDWLDVLRVSPVPPAPAAAADG